MGIYKKGVNEMKKIRLRKWVKVVLSAILLVDMFFMVCECDDIKLLFIKTLITMPIALAIVLTFKYFEEV